MAKGRAGEQAKGGARGQGGQGDAGGAAAEEERAGEAQEGASEAAPAEAAQASARFELRTRLEAQVWAAAYARTSASVMTPKAAALEADEAVRQYRARLPPRQTPDAAVFEG